MKMPHSPTLRRVTLAALVAVGGPLAIGNALAQTPPAPQAPATQAAGPAAQRGGPPPQARMDARFSPEARAEMHKRMAERHAKRQAEFKTRLQLTPQQEGAWNSFSAAMKPPAGGPGAGAPRMDREEFARLTTPQRLDRLQQIKTQRDAVMAQRADATRAFYAQLSPSQQKVFDLETLHRGHGGPGHHHRGGSGPRGEHGPMHRG